MNAMFEKYRKKIIEYLKKEKFASIRELSEVIKEGKYRTYKIVKMMEAAGDVEIIKKGNVLVIYLK